MNQPLNGMMQRRDFIKGIEASTLAMAGTAGVVSAMASSGRAAESSRTDAAAVSAYRFKLGMYLPELGLPFDESLAKAREIGAEYVWFNHLLNEPDITQMNDAQVDRMAQRVASHDLKIFLLNAGNPFKKIHLTDLDVKSMGQHAGFRNDLNALVRSMQIASRIGVRTVGSFSFAWPGEYSAGKPTWPMRWLTRGGVIADVDMDKLVKAFSMVVEQSEKYDVDVALSMMPWNYTNTTGNFRRLVERLDSRRIKVMWGPADNLNCGESDTATAGFRNIRPFLHGLHIKDLHVNDGQRLDFEYRSFGSGDVDYETVLRNVRDFRCDAVLSMSTHFRPASGSMEEAMRINFTNLRRLIQKIEKEQG